MNKTNCKKCREPTCLVFATRVAEGAKGPEDCPDMDPEKKSRLIAYISRFDLD